MKKPLMWQMECESAFKKYFSKGSKFVIVAGTGCGKTYAGALCAMHALRNIENSILFICAPYRSIKDSWVDTLTEFGLAAVSDPTDMDPNTQAFVSTYAGARGCLDYVVKTVRKKVILVLDEFHHLEESNTWAEPFKNIKDLEYSIYLSGTPWREGAAEKLMIDYCKNTEGEEVIDVSDGKGFLYTYGQNVNEEGANRNTVKVQFAPHRIVQTLKRQDAKSGEPLPDLNTDSDEMDKGSSLAPIVAFKDSFELRQRKSVVDNVIGSAVRDLQVIRGAEGLPNAGGIAFVSSKLAGEALKIVMLEVFGISAVFLHSDDPKAHSALRAFRNNCDEWIITIDMLSEGVDIPRLKVVADLSDRKTTMHIIQRWGRVLRRYRDRNGFFLNDDLAVAKIHFICHPVLQETADRIEEDIRKAYREKRGTCGDGPTVDPQEILWGDCSQEHESKPFIFAGDNKDASVTRLADWYVHNQGHDRSSAFLIAESVIENGNFPEGYDNNDPFEPDNIRVDINEPKRQTVKDKKKRIIGQYKKTIGKLAGKIGPIGQPDYKQANNMVNDHLGIKSWCREKKTLEQLEARLIAARRVLMRYS